MTDRTIVPRICDLIEMSDIPLGHLHRNNGTIYWHLDALFDAATACLGDEETTTTPAGRWHSWAQQRKDRVLYWQPGTVLNPATFRASGPSVGLKPFTGERTMPRYKNPSGVDPKEIAALGMVVKCHLSIPGLRRTDRIGSAAAAIGTQADASKAGNYVKALLDMSAEPVKAIQKARREAREAHYDNTLPWSDDGRRFLPNEMYKDYTAKMGEARMAFENATGAFLKAYPDLVEQAKKSLGSMYDPAQYPSVDDLHDHFVMDLQFEPVPQAENFTLAGSDFTAEQMARFQEGIDERIRTTVADGVDELFLEAYTRITMIADRLEQYDPQNKDADCQRLRTTLYSNLTEMCTYLPKLNVTRDERLSLLVDMIKEQVLRFNLDDLKKNKTLRKEAAKAARGVATTIEGYSSDDGA